MKWYLIAKGLCEGTDVKKVVRLDRPRTLHEFLAITKIYIRYEEELYTDNLNKSKKEEPATESSKKPFHEKKKEGKVAREGKSLHQVYTIGHVQEKDPRRDCSSRSDGSWRQATKGPVAEEEGNQQNKILLIPQVPRARH